MAASTATAMTTHLWCGLLELPALIDELFPGLLALILSVGQHRSRSIQIFLQKVCTVVGVLGEGREVHPVVRAQTHHAQNRLQLRIGGLLLFAVVPDCPLIIT